MLMRHRFTGPGLELLMSERLPIIYVRGFAGGQNAIDDAVDDPFYGFNEGSTHIRVGAAGQPPGSISLRDRSCG